MTTIKGRVRTGTGDFSRWMERLQNFYFAKTGVKFFPGTLNIELDSPYSLPKRRLRLEKEEYGGTVSVNIVPCSINGRNAFILRTDANDDGAGDIRETSSR
jgi:riboflavin kinase, archaea type